MIKINRLLGDAALVVVTIIWGSTFSLTKMGLAHVPPVLFTGLRFLLAFLVISPFAIMRLPELKAQGFKQAILVGLVFFMGFATQTVGLRYTTASKAAFITGLSVVLVPLIQWWWEKKRPSTAAVVGSLVAFAGLFVLNLSPDLSLAPSLGDLLVLVCAVAFAIHVILVNRWTRDLDPLVFTAIQIGVTGFLASMGGLIAEPFPRILPLSVWYALFFLAILATVGTTLTQVWAQRHTNPTRVAIIFTLEPVFASIFAWVILGETIALRTLVGGALILLGIILTEI